MHQAIYNHNEEFVLESGEKIPAFRLQYTTYGKLNSAKTNVVWTFHALTANSEAADWWSGIIGEGKVFDPEKYYIICANIPGSAYGSLSPLDINPKTNEKYYHDFPVFSMRDVVRTFQHLRNYLGIEKIAVGIGGSLGGMQLLEWAIEQPDVFEKIIPISTSAKTSPWAAALNASQRMSIEADCTWKEKKDDAGISGLKVARSIALLSYRDYNAYNATQQGFSEQTKDLSIDKKITRAETYQKYQGEKLAKRFNAFSYYFITRTMDTHDVGRGRISVENALGKIAANTLVMGISTDILFPPEEQELIAKHIPDAEVRIINSLYGHDGFLLEFDTIEKIIRDFIFRK
ncbi:homoserine O-acetyltransferase [Arachidicoccus ginsenosidimutans]|uniref:homoserine O-acetyltransferase family protein n=1 Tax=Arachidicoccus sp. BS20 TaxID=1850526 RepID=UPI0007F08497|nr:homoserine O-acetyltransferase [Arachidicoccus sp. BS20]ANI90353.1 homoserine O-acetyltransferase [Arachidicoccus sp. BS20]